MGIIYLEALIADLVIVVLPFLSYAILEEYMTALETLVLSSMSNLHVSAREHYLPLLLSYAILVSFVKRHKEVEITVGPSFFFSSKPSFRQSAI